MERVAPADIRKFQEIDSFFNDFAKFEGNDTARATQRQAFMADEVWAPEYSYPKLDGLYDDEKLHAKKTAIYEAVLELEAARESGDYPDAELELWANFHEVRLKKIMMVEAARRMQYENDSSTLTTLRYEYALLNEEIFGAYDQESFLGIMSSEQKVLENFVPQNAQGANVKGWLDRYFNQYDYSKYQEQPLLNEELMHKMQDYVSQRYGDILAAVPQTDDTVIYDAQQSRQIMSQALIAGGLSEEGWVVEVNPSKSNPTTSAKVKKIFLPENTQRTAAQLRRLIIHEQEVHARRGQNGINKESALLRNGTAAYADVEEGLGVLLECVVAGNMDNESYHRARDRYIVAGLALGADGTPRDARATYEVAWRLIALRDSKDGTISDELAQAAKSRAMKHVENAFRGTNFAGPGVIYPKLKVYYEGLAKNARFFEEYQDDLETAFAIAMYGKYDHTDGEERTSVWSLYGLAA